MDLSRVLALTLAVVAALAVGLWRRRTDGRLRPVDDAEVLDAVTLDAPLGTRATLVQFSSEFCQPCRATARVLADAATESGVEHVEIDAADRDDLVRRFGVRRTPTLLVLDPAGRVVRRAAGVPAAADVRDALTAAGVR